jgi:hypothetical protein
MHSLLPDSATCRKKTVRLTAFCRKAGSRTIGEKLTSQTTGHPQLATRTDPVFALISRPVLIAHVRHNNQPQTLPATITKKPAASRITIASAAIHLALPDRSQSRQGVPGPHPGHSSLKVSTMCLSFDSEAAKVCGCMTHHDVDTRHTPIVQ